jgi:hypothetical protein
MKLTYRLTVKEELYFARRLRKQLGRELKGTEFEDWCERIERTYSPEQRAKIMEGKNPLAWPIAND